MFTFKDMIKQLYDNEVPFTIIGMVNNENKLMISDMDKTEVLRHGIH